MGAHSYEDLKKHVGHKIVCVTYGDANVAVECETCNSQLLCLRSQLPKLAQKTLRKWRKQKGYTTEEEDSDSE